VIGVGSCVIVGKKKGDGWEIKKRGRCKKKDKKKKIKKGKRCGLWIVCYCAV